MNFPLKILTKEKKRETHNPCGSQLKRAYTWPNQKSSVVPSRCGSSARVREPPAWKPPPNSAAQRMAAMHGAGPATPADGEVGSRDDGPAPWDGDCTQTQANSRKRNSGIGGILSIQKNLGPPLDLPFFYIKKTVECLKMPEFFYKKKYTKNIPRNAQCLPEASGCVNSGTLFEVRSRRVTILPQGEHNRGS